MPNDITPTPETAPEAAPEAAPVAEITSVVNEVVSDAKDALETIVDAVVEAVATPAPVIGTVTVDFGPAGILTGCSLLAQYFGQDGAEHTVKVPIEGGYVALHGIPARLIK